LYHLPSDPRQEQNLIDAEPAIARALHERYVAELEAIGTDESRLALRRARPVG